MLEMMAFLLVRLMMWEFILSVGRLFHFRSSKSHKSLILVQLTLAMAPPSLILFTPKGWAAILETKGLLKIGCPRTSAWEVGLVFQNLPSCLTRIPEYVSRKKRVFLEFGGGKEPIGVMVP